MPNPVVVVGLNTNDPYCLEQQARKFLEQADQLWGVEKHLNWFADFNAKKVVLKTPYLTMLESLKYREEKETIVLLAGGDPNFFGLGSSLYKVLPPEEILIIPQPSVLQQAFAKIRVSWENAILTSVHHRSLAEVIGYAKRFSKIGILTDPIQTPNVLGDNLLRSGLNDCDSFVCERLGTKNEKITKGKLSEIIQKQYDPLNVMIIVQNEHWKAQPTPLIRPDDAYYHREGMITKADLRLMSMQRLQLSDTDIVWDIGAGSGAMSIEMAEVAWRGEVYAVEFNEEQLNYLLRNLEKFNSINVKLIKGKAPNVLENLPAPNAVFVGGSGGNLESILEMIDLKAKQGCRIVCPFVIMEHLYQAFYWMQKHNYSPQISHIQLSYSLPIGNGTRLLPINPIFIVTGIKNN